jgi:hypothetical protein
VNCQHGERNAMAWLPRLVVVVSSLANSAHILSGEDLPSAALIHKQSRQLRSFRLVAVAEVSESTFTIRLLLTSGNCQ